VISVHILCLGDYFNTTIVPQPTEITQFIFGQPLSRDAAGVAAKRERLSGRGPLRGFVGTVSEAVDLIGQYQNAGVQLLINSDYRNDMETHELMAAEVMPHFV
jgi:hypothetical protein